MATKWVGGVPCRWCQDRAKVGIEKDGLGSTYRVMCPSSGVMTRVGFNYPAGQSLAEDLRGPLSLRERLGLTREAEAGNPTRSSHI